jgi:hypothetical protein
MKNKTIAAWTALLGGPLGLHRFYLYGWSDRLGWAIQAPTLTGLYGVLRARHLGLDDQWSWVLIPFLGFTIAACALCAIVFGLTSAEDWNRRHNPKLAADAECGATHWLTVGALIASLLIGTTALMASLAFSFQRYFEYQVEAAQLQMQPDAPEKPAK